MVRRRAAAVDALFSTTPEARRAAAQALGRRELDRLRRGAADWPPLSPGAVNAWLLLVTTKPPKWRDPLLAWPEEPLTAGTVHQGFLYPDPVGFWAEIRRWITILARTRHREWTVTEALSVAALVHLGEDASGGGFQLACATCQPHVMLFLDEASWGAAALQPSEIDAEQIPDPHRVGQVYEGWWGRLADGTIVGKAPQHPTMHRLYESADMGHFLAAVPPD